MINLEVLSILGKYVPVGYNSTQRALAGFSRQQTGQWLVENERTGVYSRVGSALFLSERMDACLFTPCLRLSLNAGLLSLNSFQEYVIWLPPQAGYTAFVQLPFPAEPFCRYLAEEKRLLLLPGHVYGKAYEQFVRIGFGCSTELFEEGLTMLMHELQAWRGDELHTHE